MKSSFIFHSFLSFFPVFVYLLRCATQFISSMGPTVNKIAWFLILSEHKISWRIGTKWRVITILWEVLQIETSKDAWVPLVGASHHHSMCYLLFLEEGAATIISRVKCVFQITKEMQLLGLAGGRAPLDACEQKWCASRDLSKRFIK